MAGETYYFFFSIILVLGAILHISNMVYFKRKDKTLIGNKYKNNTLEYERLRKFSSSRNLSLAIFVALLFIANLVFDVHRIMNLSDHGYSHFILVFAPISSVLLGTYLFIYTYNKLGNNKQSGKHD